MEKDLLQRIRDGDEEAFQVLFERHRAELASRIKARLSPALRRKVSVRDVLQEAYLTAFQRARLFEDRGEDSFAHWLGKIVEHKIRDVVRHHTHAAKRSIRREVQPVSSVPTDEPTDREPSPSQHAVARETLELARSILARLPPDHAQVLRLVQEHRCSFVDAAHQLGRTEAATRKLYERALAKFAREMERYR